MGAWGVTAAGSLAGFAAEVPVITLVGELGRRWSGGPEFGSRESWSTLLATNAMTLGAMRSVGGAMKISTPWLAQGGLIAGTWLALSWEESRGLSTERSSGSRWADALNLALQFQVASNLSNRILGARFSELDRRPEAFSTRPPTQFFGETRNPATAEIPVPAARLLAKPNQTSPVPGVLMSISDRPSLSGLNADWVQRYRRLFPPAGEGVHSEEIIQTILSIAPILPRLHERLLDAFAQAPDAGSRAQSLSARAIETVFQANALKSSTAGFESVLFQELLQATLKDSQQAQRNQVMADILEQLRTGMDRSKLDGLFTKWGYGQELRMPRPPLLTALFRSLVPFRGPEEWKHYRPADRLLLATYLEAETKESPDRAEALSKIIAKGPAAFHGSATEINEALDFIRDYPLGKLALRQLLHIFATRDVPEKIHELLPLSRNADTTVFISHLENIKMGAALMATRIDGSAHTAYLKSSTLAQKVLTVMTQAESFLSNREKLEAAKHRLDDAIDRFLNVGKRLSETEMLRFLEANPSAASHALKEKIKAGEIQLQVSSEYPGGTRLPSESDSVYIIMEPDGRKARLVVRQMPLSNRASAENRASARAAIVKRLGWMIHEFERIRLIQESPGEYGFLTKPGGKISRREILVPAILADLEEATWRMAQGDLDSWEIARQFGQPLALYFREKNEVSLFRRENEKRVGDLF